MLLCHELARRDTMGVQCIVIGEITTDDMIVALNKVPGAARCASCIPR